MDLVFKSDVVDRYLFDLVCGSVEVVMEEKGRTACPEYLFVDYSLDMNLL